MTVKRISFTVFSPVGDITAGERAENIKGEDEMKTILKKLFLPLVALMVVAAFVFTACGTTNENTTGGGGGNGSPVVPDEEYYIVGIEMTTPPTNSDYGVGDVFDPTGMVLKVTWNDGWVQEIKDGQNCVITPSGPIEYGTESVKITYDTWTYDFPLNVHKITGMELTALPARTLYAEGEAFSTVGLGLDLVFDDDSKRALTSGYTLSENAASLSASDDSVTVYYSDGGNTFTADVPITVVPLSSVKVIEAEDGVTSGGEVVDNPGASSLLKYASGEGFVRNLKKGGTITINVQALKETTASLRFVASSYEDDPEGGDFAIPLQINEVVDVTFNGEPVEIGDDEILPGGYDDERGGLSRYCHWYEVALDNVTLNEGSNEFVITSKVDMTLRDDPLTTDVNEADLHSVLFDCLRVFYNDPTAVPEDYIVNVEMVTPPSNSYYSVGDTVDLTGMVLNVTWSNGREQEVKDGEGCSTTPSGPIEYGTKSVKITYDKWTFDFPINMVEIKGIELVALPARTLYAEGEAFSKLGMKLNLVFNDDSTKELTSGYTISENASALSTADKSVTITYSQAGDKFTTDVPITVVPKACYKLIEAEDGIVVNGDKVDTPGSSSLLKYASGEGFVRDFKQGGSITINVQALKETTASLRFVLSAYEDDPEGGGYAIPLQLNEIIDVTFNGEPVEIGDDEILPGGYDDERGNLSRYFHWYEVALDNVQLNEGDNEFVITSKVDMTLKTDLHSVLFDCLRVFYADSDAVPM